MPSLESILEMSKLLIFMIFVASVATQVWIATLDIAEFFTKSLNKFRPHPTHDKYSRIVAIVVGAIFLAFT